MTCDADRSQVRCQHRPLVRAALRKTTIGLRRWAGAAHLTAPPAQALALTGIQRELYMTLLGVPDPCRFCSGMRHIAIMSSGRTEEWSGV